MTPVDFLLLALLIASICATAWLAVRCARASAEARVAAERTQAANASRDDTLQRMSGVESALTEANSRLQAANAQLAEQHRASALLQKDVEVARQREEEVRALLKSTKDAMTTEFQNVANALLEAKAKNLDAQTEKTLNAVLTPFNTQLNAFKAMVEDTHKTDIRERSSLKEEIRQLTGLNQMLGAQAQSLTDALRGQAKVRGNWGEAVLARVLEASGLREGHEFDVQQSLRNEEGARLQPDVIVKLPQDRFVIIDSKLSLVAYERYVAAEDDESRAAALRAHVAAVQARISELSRKDYATLHGAKTLDFVLMFVPIEPALMLALQAAPDLADQAVAKRISLVSPNTLYTVLRTIDYIWRVDRTSRNREEIAKLGGLLYESAVLFAESMQDIGDKLGAATDAYKEARGRLFDSGRSVLKRAERLRALGVKTQKAMPAGVRDELEEDSAGVGEPGPTLDALPDRSGRDESAAAVAAGSDEF